MKVFRVAALFVLLTGPAYAQMPNINLLAPDKPAKTEEQIEQENHQQKAYQDSLRSIPDAKVSNDPWGNVRSQAPKTPPAKSSAKAMSSAKAKSKAKAVAKTGQQ